MRSTPFNHKILNNLMFKAFKLFKNSFTCPACDYKGPFKDLHLYIGSLKHAQMT